MNKDINREPKYMKIYEEVATIIGEENIENFFNNFRGQQIEFPVKLYSREYVQSQTIKSLTQKKDSIKNLAHTFGYSERYLRKLIKNYNNNNK